MPASSNSLLQASSVAKAKQRPQEVGLSLDYIPQPPDDLTEEAVLFWNFYCQILLEGRCLRRHHITSIHNLCILHMLRSAYMVDIASSGVVIDEQFITRDGIIQYRKRPNPVCDKLQKAILDMDRILASMCLTGYTDHILPYDSSGGQILKGKVHGPPLVSFSPESPTS